MAGAWIRSSAAIPMSRCRYFNYTLGKAKFLTITLSFPFSFQAREVGMKAFDLVKQLPQQESLGAIGHLLKLINSKPSHTK